MNKNETSDIFIEALEVFINHILYVRDLYPAQIFQKRRIYNTPVFISIYPPLNVYLQQALRAALMLKRRNELERVELQFYGDQMHTIHEKYIFQFCETTTEHARVPQKRDDQFLLDFEEQLRRSLYAISDRAKPLPKLPSSTKFKVLLHTTQAAFVRLSQDGNYQDFPWLQEEQHDEEEKTQIRLLPLTRLKTACLEIIAEV